MLRFERQGVVCCPNCTKRIKGYRNEEGREVYCCACGIVITERKRSEGVRYWKVEYRIPY